MKIIIALALSFISLSTQASYPEFFGSHPSTSGIANQANTNEFDPANNYYIPALMAFSDTITFSASAGTVATDFEPIKNVVVKNSTNSGLNTSADVNTDYDSFYGATLHTTLPLAYKGAGTVNLSIFTPLGSISETNSGDAHLPEYVMYRSRYRRTMVYLNYAQRLGENFAFSLGTHVGFQAGASAQTNLSLNGTSYGSSGSAKSEVKPSLAGIFSLIYKLPTWSTYFTFQQEMKSNIEAQTAGEINDPTAALFLINIESMAYYDPHTFRFGTNFKLGPVTVLGALEYQIWDNYKTPVVHIKDRGGVVLGSNDYEQIKLRNILVPKFGLIFDLTDNFSILSGISYKPTPLDGDFSGAGNSIDTNSLIFSVGSRFDFTMFGKKIDLTGSAQYHKLEELNVQKSVNQENGNSGNKIGAPGYKIGGSVIAASAGFGIKF